MAKSKSRAQYMKNRRKQQREYSLEDKIIYYTDMIIECEIKIQKATKRLIALRRSKKQW